MSVYKFAYHDRVANTPPEGIIPSLYYKCKQGEKLTSEEKQKIYDATQADRGAYKLGGWEFNFREFMKRYIVNHYGNWNTCYAFSKSNIKNNLYTKTGIKEIYEIPKKS